MAILVGKNLPFGLQDVTTDPAGRYVLVHCQIYSESWTLMNLYAPNTDDDKFIRDNFLRLADSHENILVGRYFNCCLDPVLDRSGGKDKRTKAAKAVLGSMGELNLMDIWRRLHPGERDYSFYSRQYDSYSRIDLFLTSAQLQSRIIGTEYKARLLSDHSPLVLTIDMPDK